MDFSQNEVSPVRRYGGLSVVVLVHILVAYALITGLAHKSIDVIMQPVETKIIEEVKPPPPPNTLPPPPPRMAAPPPPFIPPPEVQIQQPQSPNVIAAPSTVQPAQTQPFQKSVVTAAPPAPTPVAAPPVPAFVDLNACKPEYPRSSLLAEEQGTVTVQFVIGADAQLVGATVVKSSGFKNLDRATVNALSHCKFKAAYKEGKPVQSSFMSNYVWKLED